MSGRRALIIAIAWTAIAVTATGCKKYERKASTRPAPFPEAQAARGRAACDDLVAKECACAAAQPSRTDIADRCKLDRARPDALALALETAMRPDVDNRVVIGAQNTARQIIDNCVTDVAMLPSLGCH
jgi:hypothetical protein